MVNFVLPKNIWHEYGSTQLHMFISAMCFSCQSPILLPEGAHCLRFKIVWLGHYYLTRLFAKRRPVPTEAQQAFRARTEL